MQRISACTLRPNWTLLVAAGLLAITCPVKAGEPSSENDYGRSKLGGIQWESLLTGNGIDGWAVGEKPWVADAWWREGNTIVAATQDGPRARITIGDETWRAYELKVQVTMVTGGGAPQLWFNIHENRDHHFAPLLGWQTAAIMDPHHHKLDVVNHVFELGREYDVVLAVRGRSVTTYIDGVLTNRVTLAEDPIGGVGLAVWGRHTEARFRDPKIRHYYKAKHGH